MPSYEFKPILEENLAEVARFLYEQQEINFRDDPTQAAPQGTDLRWMLVNPDRRDDAPMGEVLRDSEGRLAGMIIAVPRLYLLGGRKMIGLAAGQFYVEAAARMQGFFMLRRFFKMPHADFWFANSCNRQSAPLWAKCGAMLVPESDVEYLYPIRLGPLLEEVAGRKGWPRPVATLLATLGPGADVFASLRFPKNRFKLERTTDVEKLAAIAERNGDPKLLQPVRDVKRLGWQYGNPPPFVREGEGKVFYTFTGGPGEEGWFALEFGQRGRRQQVKNAAVLDASWPEARFPFVEILPAILAAARPFADLLSIRGRPGLKLSDGAAGLKRRALLAPEAFLLSQSPATSELGPLADFPGVERY